MSNLLRVAACHASPVFLNARKTTDKAISLIQEAASRKANLIVFPETFISAFPIWSSVRPPTENHSLFERMVQESVYADGEEMNAVRETARSTGTIVSIGFSEKSRYSNGCLFNSNLTIGPNGEVLVHHRKLVPTFFEKLTWSPGDGHGLRVADTKFGRIGTLICGENTNALARYTLIAQAQQVHISTWPAIWPTRVPRKIGQSIANEGSEGDASTGAASHLNYDNLAANRTRAAAHCFEAKCFGIACSGHLGEDAIATVVEGVSRPDVVADTLRAMPRAATFFLDPTGAPLPSFTWNGNETKKERMGALQNKEGILYTDMNLDDCIEGKQYHDVVGGYQRLDVFDLKVDRSRREPVCFTEQDSSTGNIESL
ncbi:nitrilase [Plenodomus tracheiphilus IPT5]|uniref:Nitrilase n=1 Tax=Plenodomus tracheiphilus IPT5 TaxID=1408161 RepID=A0A6A7B6Q0_9PLEO|nr:nitrilase [Plenodomus tracheiphilus IPT5]